MKIFDTCLEFSICDAILSHRVKGDSNPKRFVLKKLSDKVFERSRGTIMNHVEGMKEPEYYDRFEQDEALQQPVNDKRRHGSRFVIV